MAPARRLRQLMVTLHGSTGRQRERLLTRLPLLWSQHGWADLTDDA